MVPPMDDPWFFVETLPPVGDAAELDLREARHVAAARRLRAGDDIILFDGRGEVAEAVIERVDERSLLAARVRSIRSATQQRIRIHIASGLPKGDRLSVMLSMLTQVGMTDFTPLRTHRAVVEPRPSAPDRWRRLLIEACKQSQRAFVPVLHPAATVESIIETARSSNATLLFAHPGGRPVLNTLIETVRTSSPSLSICLVGPEGGFAETEVTILCQSGAFQVDLGPAILRIETAAVLMAGAAMLAAQRHAPAR